MPYLPPALRPDDGYFWFLRHVWWRMLPPQNKHFAVVLCAESGGGKSYNTISCAHAIYPDLDINESFCFDAKTFSQKAASKQGRAFPLIMDDAGLAAFSGDALTKEVGYISKIAQSIRHKHWQVYINIPNMDLLAKSVRIINQYYMEPVWIDYSKELCYTKFQRISVPAFGGTKLIRKNIIRRIKVTNPVTGHIEIERHKHLTVPVPHPPKNLAKNYENIRAEYMDTFRRETGEDIDARKARQKRHRPSTQEIISIIKQDRKQFFSPSGKVRKAVLVEKFAVGTSTAYQIARMIDSEEFV